MARKASQAKLVSKREASLQAVPHPMPYVRKKEENGKLYITIEYNRPRWQQMLGAEQMAERTFGLDDYGRRVYESCNGSRTVQQVITKFAKSTRISKAEAETAVAKFLRTLLMKGLIAMEMEKPKA